MKKLRLLLSMTLIFLLALCFSSCFEGIGSDKSTATFYVDGELFATVEGEAGKIVPPEVTDIPEGYELSPWYSDSAYTLEYRGGKKGYARIVPKQFHITYDVGNVDPLGPLTYTFDTPSFTFTTPPEREGCTLIAVEIRDAEGNLLEITGVEKGHPVGDLFVKAVYEYEVYHINYEYPAGVTKGENPATYTVDTIPAALVEPTKTGYAFTGWHVNGGAEVTKTFPNGTGDVTLSAVLTPIEYRIILDLDGGTSANPATYTVETPTFSLLPPTNGSRAFTAWEKDGRIMLVYTIEQGTVGDISLRAIWDNGQPLLSYSTETVGATVSANVPVGGVVPGTRVSVVADGMVGDDLFKCWKMNGVTVSESPYVNFEMPGVPCTLVAEYQTVNRTEYDKKSASGLSFTASANVVYVLGGSARAGIDFTTSGKTVTFTADYLAALTPGDYTYFVRTSGEDAYFYLRVKDTRRVTGLKIDYDVAAFPNVEIVFDCSCGGEHTASLDGGASFAVESGKVLTGYAKDRTHTLTVSCADGEGSSTVSVAGYSIGESEYFTKSFTYLGRTWDYAVYSEEEFRALAEYLILVRGVLEYHGTEETFYFYVGGPMTDVFGDSGARQDLFSAALQGMNCPMSPQYSALHYSTKPHEYGISITYSHGFNSVKSGYETTTLPGAEFLLPRGSRPAGYETFPVDLNEKTLTVRTLYELETVPLGYKLVMDSGATEAKAVYNAARSVLREIVDDTMNDFEKVEAMYKWLAVNVTYDNVAFSGGADASKYRAFTTAGVFLDKLAVCDGYAGALRLMCVIEGIACEEVRGMTDPRDEASGHAWNKVQIGGLVYGIDATWSRVGGDLVTFRTLFLGEGELIDTEHYENSRTANYYADEAAYSTAGYYAHTLTDGGFDFTVDNLAEYIALVRYAKKAGLPYVEFKIASGSAQDYLNQASYALHGEISFSASHTSSGTYYILLDD